MDKRDMEYTDKLRNPKWQKKRLEILERDKFQCTNCGDTDAELHVHHTYYPNYNEPWNTENSYLLTLCNSCHKDRHDIEILIKKNIGLIVNNDCLSEIGKLISKIDKENPNMINMLNKVHNETKL